MIPRWPLFLRASPRSSAAVENNFAPPLDPEGAASVYIHAMAVLVPAYGLGRRFDGASPRTSPGLRGLLSQRVRVESRVDHARPFMRKVRRFAHQGAERVDVLQQLVLRDGIEPGMVLQVFDGFLQVSDRLAERRQRP